MKTVFLLFDSLNRRALSCYGGAIPTPNFDRLAARGVRFDTHYVGSLPCMPARRDMMTGRLGFMHRSWGPLEPFDDNFPELLRQNGVYSHLVTDHYHYFQDGGSTYHNRYSSYDFIRGQESDHWIADVNPPMVRIRDTYHPNQIEEHRNGHRLQGAINRTALKDESDYPIVKCFDAGLDFLARNGESENWLLQIETFDPHEPFVAPDRYRAKFPSGYNGPIYDWPRYRASNETPEETGELRRNYAALVAFCDDQLGRLLDDFDANNRWKDTAIVLTTDHGLMLGEHDWWGKNQMPFYDEIARIPLIVVHPDMTPGTSDALTQTTDIMPTLLDLFGIAPPEDVTGASVLPVAQGRAEKVRDLAIFGIYAGAVNATDGKHMYFRYPDQMTSTGMYEYTLMPMHNYTLFEPRELAGAEFHPGFDFTKDAPVLRVSALTDAKRSPRQGGFFDTETRLFDLASDPGQTAPFRDAAIEARFCNAIAADMARHDAPDEIYMRWDLNEYRQEARL